MINIIIIISMLLISLILIAGVSFYAIKRHYDIKDKEIQNISSTRYLSIEISDEKFQLLDKIIEREFNDYVKLHPNEFDDSGNGYMNEENYNRILKDITRRIYNNITPALKANIALVYKFETEQDQLTLILEKIGVMLALYRARMNSAVIDDSMNEKTTSVF